MDTFRFAQKDKIISHEDIDADHGRIETRICTVTNDLSLLTGAENWKDINALVKIEITPKTMKLRQEMSLVRESV